MKSVNTIAACALILPNLSFAGVASAAITKETPAAAATATPTETPTAAPTSTPNSSSDAAGPGSNAPETGTPSEGDAEKTSDTKAVQQNLKGEKPSMVFSSTRQDFGEIFRGQKVSHAFSFVNKGSGVLKVRSIHSSCGCLQTRVEPKREFQPGEEGKISFTFDSSFFAENVVRTLTVDSNSSSNSTTVLTFTARVKEEIRAKPTLVSLGEMDRDGAKEVVIQLQAFDKAPGQGAPLEVAQAASVSTDVALIKKSLQEETKVVRPVAVISSSPLIVPALEDEGKVLRLKVSGPLPPGPLREHVTVYNTSTHLKEMVIPVVGEVFGHVRPSTKYLEFGIVRPSAPTRRALELKSTQSNFQVDSVAVDLRQSSNGPKLKGSEVVSYTLQKGSNGVTLQFDMKVPNKLEFQTPSVNISGTVVVRTNDPDYKEMRVPFFGVIKQDAE